MNRYLFYVLAACVSLTGCRSLEHQSAPSHVSPWDISIRDFHWTKSPEASIAQLEERVRSATHNRHISLLWPDRVDIWTMQPRDTETASLLSLVYRAGSGAGLNVNLSGDSAIFTRSIEDTFVPFTFLCNIDDAETKLPVDKVTFEADTLLPLEVNYLRKGCYSVTTFVPLRFSHYGSLMIIDSKDLFAPTTVRVCSPGFEESKIAVRAVGYENAVTRQQVYLKRIADNHRQQPKN